LQSFKHADQVPTPVVPGEGVDLVDHDRPQVCEQRPGVDAGGHQHRLQRLRSGEQDVRRLAQHALAAALVRVAVPQPGAATEPGRVAVDPRLQVVEQGA